MYKATEQQMKHVLFSDDARLRIPAYQRPYTWSDNEIEDLWDDLTAEQDHFIGSFIFNTEHKDVKGYLEVIDGQQRLISITILLSAMRDLSDSLGFSDLSGLIHRKAIGVEDIKGGFAFRLSCGKSLNKFFTAFIQNKTESADVNPSSKEERTVVSNYNLFANKINTQIKELNSAERESFIQNLFEKIYKINCISIYISDEEDAYTIFETVNARGIDLSVADLLKNLLFSKLDKKGEVEYAKEQWDRISEGVTGSGAELHRFLRHSWLSRDSFATEKELYRKIKKTKKDYKELIDELLADSDIYSRIYTNRNTDWDEFNYSKKIHSSILAINIMGITQCYVLILSLIRNADKIGKHLPNALKQIENFSFLYSAISKLQANKVEKIYSRYAVRLEKLAKLKDKKDQKKKMDSLFHEFTKELNELKPGKELFCEKFQNVEYKNSAKARKMITYILDRIYLESSNKELVTNFEEVNIEHIIPQNPDKSWGLKKSEMKEYVNQLGNLVLVSKRINSKAGNKTIEEKCEILLKTEISTTKKLIEEIVSNKYKWDEIKITERQNDLAEEAFRVWAI